MQIEIKWGLALYILIQIKNTDFMIRITPLHKNNLQLKIIRININQQASYLHIMIKYSNRTVDLIYL